MALEAQELREEQAQQLRQLATSPGWELYKAHLRSLARCKSKETAVALRVGEFSRAALHQGHVDGLDDAATKLSDYITSLGVARSPDAPAY